MKRVCFIRYHKQLTSECIDVARIIGERLDSVKVGIIKLLSDKDLIKCRKLTKKVEIFQIPDLSRSPLLNQLHFFLEILRILKKEQTDLVLVEPFLFSFLLPLSTKKYVKRFILYDWTPPVVRGEIKRILGLILDLPNIKAFEKILVFSELHRYLDLYAPPFLQSNKERFQSFKAGVNTSLFCPGKCTHAHALPPKPRIVYCGSLDRLRRIQDLIRSFEYASDEIPNLSLVLIGERNNYVNRLLKESRVSERIITVGYVDHSLLPSYLRCFDIGLAWVPIDYNYFFNTSFKILEYLSVGIPVVATKTFANKAIVKEEYNGLLRSDEPRDFAKGITRLINDEPLRFVLSQNARNSVLELDWHRVVDDMILPVIEPMLK